MAKVSKTIVDAQLRARVFDILLNVGVDEALEESPFVKINDRQYGIILKDANGHERYVRVGAIVAEEREDISARDLMSSEIKAYEDKVAERKAKEEARAKKAEADKAKREAKAQERGE